MQVPASTLIMSKDYPNFPEFQRFNIDLKYMDARVILALQKLRVLSGVSITPSPRLAGWYRFKGSVTSQHYAVKRLSTAGDFFPTIGDAFTAWHTALSMPEIGGVGLYLDTKGLTGKLQLMVHIDVRTAASKVLWVRDVNGKTHTRAQSPGLFKHWVLEGFKREQTNTQAESIVKGL